MSAITESYQRKLKAILASEEKLDNGQTTTPFYENKLLANSIIKLVLENFPKNKQESIMDPFKVSQLLFADAVKEKKVPSAEQFALKIKNNQQVRSLFQVRKYHTI